MAALNKDWTPPSPELLAEWHKEVVMLEDYLVKVFQLNAETMIEVMSDLVAGEDTKERLLGCFNKLFRESLLLMKELSQEDN